MRRLVRWTAGLSLALIIAVITVRVSGGNQPAPESLSRWHLLDCVLPCWGGFAIGHTPETEAEVRVKKLFAPPDYAVLTSRWLPGSDLFITVKAGAETQSAREISVSFAFANTVTTALSLTGEDMPRLGDLLNLLGPPSCVFVGDVQTSFLVLYYEGLRNGQSISIGVSPAKWFTPVGTLGVGQ